MAVKNAQQKISEAVLSWPAVTAHPHRFGGTEYRLGKRELGHIHGDYLVDIPFPKKVRDEIIAAGQAGPHHILRRQPPEILKTRTTPEAPKERMTVDGPCIGP